jgi:GT2 family glycosyltransferase/glycosyltransferase involved in cell wall biosynthesis
MFWLISALRPQTFVELGAHLGYSYFAACQAVRRLDLSTICHAVDNWKGDEHAGFYGDEIYRDVLSYNQHYYSGFSTLIRANFADARSFFPDASIELLHIDGRHYYDDVREDFLSWRGKLAENAIVLFHDTNVREHEFGVWKFFRELRDEYRAFEFKHGHGLGVLATGQIPDGLEHLFSGDPQEAHAVRETYSALGLSISRRSELMKNYDDLMKNYDDLTKAHDGLRQQLAMQQARLEDMAAEARDSEAQLRAATEATADSLRAREDMERSLRAEIAGVRQGSSLLIEEANERAITAAGEIPRLQAEVAEVRQEASLLVEKANERARAAAGESARLQAEAKRALEQWQQQLRHLDEQRDNATAQAQLVRAVTERADELEARVQAIYGSTSWRITGPMRRTVRLLRRIGARTPASTDSPLAHADPTQADPASAPKTEPSKPSCSPTSVARRILVMDYRIPRPDISAGERATMGILADLRALGYEVVFIPHDMAASDRYEQELGRLGVTVVTDACGHASPHDYLRQHGNEFGAYYLFRVDVAEAVIHVIREVAPNARVIFHAPDLHFLREEREAVLQASDASRLAAAATKRRELEIILRCDHAVIVSSAELLVLRDYLPESRISVFPALYASVDTNPAPSGQRRDLLYLGGFGHPPNTDAIHWFVAEIWPLVQARLSDVQLDIVGAEMPQSVHDLAAVPGVNPIGYVDDLAPILAGHRIAIAPLRYGAGIKGKVAMAMGAGMACVCTTIAAEGMGIEDGTHALVADDPADFAAAIIGLYQDTDAWTGLAANGLKLVARKFGAEANRASLTSALNDAQALPVSLFVDYCRGRSPAQIPAPAQDEQVDVSIIMPVYNQWPYTRACLNSILATTICDDIHYEIILADDNSTDETECAAILYPGLRVVRTKANVGFIRNCNNAARHARGRYLVFLNNDTIALPGWLSMLYRAIENDPGAAIAGSKLLYPNGIIQEAGALIFSDGTAVNAGRGSGRHSPLFNIPRETDYISGCSIIVRRSFWNVVDGFDERYRNAYCEDCDLAMAARAVGMRVIYEPKSEIIHFEHQSYAEQAPSHDTALQQHNTALMLEKWGQVLRTGHEPATVPWHLAMRRAERTPSSAALARRQTGEFNILYFSPFPSHPPSHGNRTIINRLGRSMQGLGHNVHFVVFDSECSDEGLRDMRMTWDSLDVVSLSNPMIGDGSVIPFDGWYVDGLGERIRGLCAKYDIDIVYCMYVFQSKILEFVPDYVLKVIDTHDKMSNRYGMLRAKGLRQEFFSCTPEEEASYLRRADVVVARRKEEATYFDAVTGRKSAVTLSHVEEPKFVRKDFDRVKNVGIVASANQLNLHMVQECLETIDRRLRQAESNFNIHVAGQVKDMISQLPDKQAAVFRRPWVQLHGFVPDIQHFYQELDMVLSPVTMGTGINVKTVEAMVFGMPLLTTLCGSKGIETEHPMHRHADLEALTDSLFALSADPAELERLATLSRKRYQRFYLDNTEALKDLLAHPKLRRQPSAA